MTNKKSKGLLFFLLLFALISCETEKRIPPDGYLPNTPKSTEMLEAAYFWIPQDQLKSSYWNDANYVEVKLTNGATKNLYDAGYLNMTGTYNGVSDFNNGKDPMVKLKAGYDDEYLYILVEWKDTTTNASFMTRLFNGGSDAHKPGEDAEGWSSQRNQDILAILFNNTAQEHEVWKWSMASTAPFNMALSLKTDAEENIIDDSEFLIPNSSDENPTSGPQYEWSGERQEILLADGSSRLLDPAYYLLEMPSMKTKFVGDAVLGRPVFNDRGSCNECHGPDGNGVLGGDAPSNGGALNQVFTNRYSREGLVEFMNSTGHEGRSYWGRIKNDSAAVVDILAFLRGIAGQPGHTIAVPESEPEIRAYTNVAVGTIQSTNSQYSVLFRRKLTTANSGNVQFDPLNNYTLSLRLSDNDEINYVASGSIELIFNSK